MGRKTRKEMRAEAAKKRRQQILNLKSRNQKKQQDLKTKKLSRSLYIRDSRGRVKKKKTGLSNIPAAEGMATVNRKARGLSNLPSNYKKEEKKFSDKAKETSKYEYSKRFPKMGTYKSNKTGGGSSNDKSTNNKSTNNSKLKAGSARERLRAKNVERFGKAHVDRLVAKNKEFQAAKKDKEKMKAYRKKYGK